MPENFWQLQREIGELLAKKTLNEGDLAKIEHIRDELAAMAA